MTHDELDMVTYGDEPAALLFADGEPARERCRVAAERAGCRIVGIEPVAAGAARLDRQAKADVLLIELEGEGPGTIPLLDAAEQGARLGRFGAVVSAPTALIDLVAARTPDAAVIQLCEPSEAERIAAIAIASNRPQPRLHDVGRRRSSTLLQQLSEEAGRLANILAALSEEEPAAAAAAPGVPSEAGDGSANIDAPAIRAIIRARRLRGQYFNEELFADPAWDILLDLMAARLEAKRVAVSSLCIAAAVPATTALRWIKSLTDQGLLVRQADPQDGRRVYIELSDAAARALNAYFAAAQRISPWAI